ncbi:MAG TPA: potassium transporter TrkA [Spirochaetaceae bacterium]|nr:potassium transporter TrkA [Spirochaetaceae bacterium]
MLVLVAGLVLTLFQIASGDGQTFGLVEALWQALMRTIDAGAVTADSGWQFRAVMFVVTLGGIFILSALIGILNTGLEASIDELRKGRSIIVEQRHTVILGWNDDIFAVLEQLIQANANQRRACVAILAPKDKVEMEDELRERLGKTRTTRLVCRTGNPRDAADLAIVATERSRSIIIMSPRNQSADAEIIKTLLAITARPHLGGAYNCVAEIRDPRNLHPAGIAARGQAQIVLVGSMISRLVAQTCRQSGLSIVYEGLLSFAGDELYFAAVPALIGLSYAEAINKFRTSSIIGLVRPDGVPQVNPPAHTRIEQGWQVIAISQDDDTVLPDAGVFKLNLAAIAAVEAGDAAVREDIIFVGWNWKLPQIIHELDAYVGPGSQALVLGANQAGAQKLAALQGSLHTFGAVEYRQADITDRSVLEALPLASASHIVVLSNSEDFDPDEADARTLIALLHLRDLARLNGYRFSLTSELLDTRTQELASIAEADDFIVSDRLIGLLLVQIAENPALNAVFTDLFDPDGSEIYFKPIEDYIKPGLAVDGYTVYAAATRQNQSVIGWRLQQDKSDASRNYGVYINPHKDGMVQFAPGDKLIVLSED